MGSWQKSLPSMFAVLVIVFLFSNCFALGRSAIAPDSSRGKGLRNHSEIHEAKNLIDALSTKLHLNLQTYESKYENFKQQSDEYLKQSGSTKDEIKMLIKLQDILNDLTNSNVKSSICQKFWKDCDFTVARQIIINSKASALQKYFTITVQVNHRALIDDDSALENGNDLRVYFQKEKDCQPREIDRILENIATTKTKVLFKLQEDLPKTGRDGSVYYLVYGNTNAGKAKHNPENVYLFYDDFSDSNLKKIWQKNWGLINIENGVLTLSTGNTPTEATGEISVFVKHGYEWEDIEVELDFYERNSPNVYPGPYLRVEDARIKTTSAWWFEYSLEKRGCTMRPYKNNRDGGWLYKGTLTKPLSPRTWTHAKYRVVGDRFSHWINNDLIHDNVQVASKWMINKGTFGLGCYKSDVGCHTSYDNIKITKYVSVLPIVSLGAECKVDLKKFHGVGKSEKNPATSCKQIHDVSLQDGKHRLKNGVYWIKTSADSSAPTYCDLVNGGWTLVGKVSRFVNKLYKFWLIKNVNVDALAKADLPSKVGCIDARYLATYHASTVMFSSGDNQNSIGTKWVKWSLPEGRDSDTLWTHSVGYNTVSKVSMDPVTVKAWNGGTKVCYQNKFGIMLYSQHGGSYPSATYNTVGNTKPKDYCMAVGVQKKGTTADGWSQNGNGYDSPRSNSDWLNAQYNHGSPYVTVWLK